MTRRQKQIEFLFGALAFTAIDYAIFEILWAGMLYGVLFGLSRMYHWRRADRKYEALGLYRTTDEQKQAVRKFEDSGDATSLNLEDTVIAYDRAKHIAEERFPPKLHLVGALIVAIVLVIAVTQLDFVSSREQIAYLFVALMLVVSAVVDYRYQVACQARWNALVKAADDRGRFLTFVEEPLTK